MLFVELDFFQLVPLGELYDPARVQIDTETDSAAVLGQVFNRKPETPTLGTPVLPPVSKTKMGRSS
jgi:hypothetical protein